MNVLVTGGAGYIGSHMVKMLAGAGHQVVTWDNLSTGFREAVRYGAFVEGDLHEHEHLVQTLRQFRVEAVVHFAARIEVGESVREPHRYYENNVGGTLSLLSAMREAEVRQLVFSSTAAVYGEPEAVPIPEGHPQDPTNPYGASKCMVERILRDGAAAGEVRSLSLRYFNAAGADPDGELGERHDPETHLIPLALQAASGRREAIAILGRDYPTSDGTCIRDFIHVQDLCAAHLAALDYLSNGGDTVALNLGTGKGASVQSVIDTVSAVTGRQLQVEEGLRRPGDPAWLVADPTRSRELLGWTPRISGLERIVEDAWRWELAQCDQEVT